ncbi:MAG TPA: hypothetical protein VJ577_09630 [Burkholderiaceae bacterium]|nr:hypothetical protein [Burkholderiaceae bacterium]
MKLANANPDKFHGHFPDENNFTLSLSASIHARHRNHVRKAPAQQNRAFQAVPPSGSGTIWQGFTGGAGRQATR